MVIVHFSSDSLRNGGGEPFGKLLIGQPVAEAGLGGKGDRLAADEVGKAITSDRHAFDSAGDRERPSASGVAIGARPVSRLF